MKIIDHTPLFNSETGEITILDRTRAMMKYGGTWLKEVEAQKEIINIIGKVLDRNYTLLRNVTPPGLGASFPLILIGPTGVYVMDVTPLTGMFRARGDQWGTISGDAFKNEKPNLMTRTERMARAIQVFLQRQGYSSIFTVEAVLLCSDLSIHVDSIRPIIRVVMRDALERFAVSIAQGRVVLAPDAVQDIVGRLLNPPIPAQPSPVASPLAADREPSSFPLMGEAAIPAPGLSPDSGTGIPENVTAQEERADIPAFSFPQSQSPVMVNEADPFPLEEQQDRSQAPAWFNEQSAFPLTENQDLSQTPAWSSEPTALPVQETGKGGVPSPRSGWKKSQRALIAILVIIWILLIGVFLFVVIRDQWSYISGLLP